MKRPKEPKPLIYWLSIARDREASLDFETRGDSRQKKQLSLAKKFIKW